MEKISQLIKSIYGYSGNTVVFIGRNLGLRTSSAAPLTAEEMTRLYRALRLLVTVMMLVGVTYGFLVYNLRAGVDAMLASEKPGFDIEALWSRWTWQFYASLALLAVSTILLGWAASLYRRFKINPVFVFAIVLLCVAALLWRPCARIVITGKLLSLYSKGFGLWKSKEWKDCYRYYDRLYRAFPRTFIADNCLGRMAGSEFHSESYGNAIKQYALLLQQFADTDIRPTVEFSVRLTMRKLWAERGLAKCAAIYRETALADLGFSVYEFLLNAPKAGEAARPHLYGSLPESERQAVLELMAMFPNDLWADRAAFLAGKGELLRTQFPKSRYSVTSGVVEGWELQKVQAYGEAATRYVSFLETRPPLAEQKQVRHLLALCYLASQELEEALTNLLAAATTEHSIPTGDHHLFLARFALMDPMERMQELFDRVKSRMPNIMAADMAAILAERLELSGADRAGEVRTYRAFARRALALSQGVPSNESSYDRVSSILLELKSADNLVGYYNSRAKQTDSDASFMHYLDRNYEEQKGHWPDTQEASYTALLNARVKKEFEAQVQQKAAWTHKLKFAAEVLEGMKDPNCLRASVGALVADLDVSKTPLNETQLVLLRRISKRIKCEPFERIAARALRHAFGAGQGDPAPAIGQCFRMGDIVPSSPVLSELAAVLFEAQKAITNSAEYMSFTEATDKTFRRAEFRTRMAPYVVPVLGYCYSATNRFRATRRAQEGRLRLAELCLRNPGTYALAGGLLEGYINEFPKSDYSANCRLWLGWLSCYEANRHRDITWAYAAHYRSALTNYLQLVDGTSQQRLDVLGREAARKIRLKLDHLATGRYGPRDYQLPVEIARFGLPSSLLAPNKWSVNYKRGRNRWLPGAERKGQFVLRFERDLLKGELYGQEVQIPYHLTVRDGKPVFNAVASLDGTETYVVRGAIADRVLSGSTARLDWEGKIIEINEFTGTDAEPPPSTGIPPVVPPVLAPSTMPLPPIMPSSRVKKAAR